MLKDISSTFSQNRVNIQTINVIRQAGYPIVKIRCALNDKNKIEKIIFKLKKIKGVKEINYKLN